VQRSTILLSAGPAIPGAVHRDERLTTSEPIPCKGIATRPPGFVERELRWKAPAGDRRRHVVGLRPEITGDGWYFESASCRAVGAVTVADVSRVARRYIARPAVVFMQSPEAAGP
jgi:hypothetical protein